LRFLSNVSSDGDGTPDYLGIGRIIKPHGLRGEVILAPLYNVVQSAIPELNEVICSNDVTKKRLRILKCRPHKGRFIVKFEKFDGIEESQSLVDKQIYAPAEFFEKKIRDKILLRQLGELAVHGEDKERIGTLKSIFETPAHPVLIIESEKGKELMLPEVDHFIKEIDVKNRKLIIAPPEGLFDIYDI